MATTPRSALSPSPTLVTARGPGSVQHELLGAPLPVAHGSAEELDDLARQRVLDLAAADRLRFAQAQELGGGPVDELDAAEAVGGQDAAGHVLEDLLVQDADAADFRGQPPRGSATTWSETAKRNRKAG